MSSEEVTAPPDPVDDRRHRPLVAAVLSAVVPGLGQWYAGRRRRAVVLLAISGVLLLGAALWFAVDPVSVAKLAFRPGVLRGLLAIDVAVLALRVWATWDAYRCVPGPAASSRPVAASIVAVAAVVLVLPHAAFAYYDLVQLDLITSVFASPPTTITTTASPTAAPPTTTPGTASVTTLVSEPPPSTQTPTTTTSTRPPVAWDGVERLNILLLGSDAGVGRTGVRTDTIVLVSIDPDTGETALFGVPRNFARVPMPSSVDLWACECFPPILNELYGFAERNPESFPGSATPGANALKGAVGELLGIPVHYYALVALDGFVDLVDALGGVTITVLEPIYDPAYPKEDGGTEVIDLEPGTYRFDGHLALAFARSRYSSDDYSRMGRQRCVLEGLVTQADPVSLLRGFPAVADVIKRSVETDIPIDAVPDLIELAAMVDTERALSLPLVPPTYVGGRTPDGFGTPDVELIRDHVRIATTLPVEEAIALLGIDPLADACGGS